MTTTIRKLQAGDEEALKRFLEEYVESSMFLLSNMRTSGLEYQAEPYRGEYIGSFTGTGQINDVLAHYWNGNVLPQSPDLNILKNLTRALRENISRPIAGFVGPDEQVNKVLEELDLSSPIFALNSNEELYALELDKLKFPQNLKNQNYQMVHVSKANKTTIKEWTKAYHIEALEADDNEDLEAQITKDIDHIMQRNDCWVLEVDSKPVAASAFNARLPDSVQIGAVWTPPEHRSKGYARTIVAMTLEHAKKQGVKKAILFTDVRAAKKAYSALGFQQIGYYTLVLLKTPVELH